ncbi:MAG: glycoside hydrolase family 5 protein [Clostridia bacterium]|nr:glycoside hydrolase family 5 protein [Clostridia bacterium]
MKKSILSALLSALLLLSSCTAVADPVTTGSNPVQSTDAGTYAVSDTAADTDATITEPPFNAVLEPQESYYEGERYADCVSNDMKLVAGVVGKTNFFAPGSPVPVWLWSDPSLDGLELKVTFYATGLQSPVIQTVTLSSERETRFCFCSERCGVGTVTLSVSGTRLSFTVGIMPKNEMAADSFYYGIQPYIARVMTWGSGSYVAWKDKADSVTAILDTAEWLGINLIREDGIPWEKIQPSAGAACDFTMQDELLSLISGRGITLDWIVASTPEWAVAEKYRTAPEAAWQKCPDTEAWRGFITAVAGHYAGSERLIFEIRNEPDWSFFTGTPEEYFTLLDIAGRAIRTADPKAFVFAGGLALGDSQNPYYKNPALYFAAYKPLIEAGVIDTYAYHIHSGMNSYFQKIGELDKMVSAAGLPGGAINSESGLGAADPGALMVKALKTRARGDRGFVQFSFRKTPVPSGDVDKFAVFDTALCPTESAVAYGAMIRFLGRSRLLGSAFSEPGKNVDVYSTEDGKTVAVYYNNGNGGIKVRLPEKECKLFDLYGNPKSQPSDGFITLTDAPVYAVFDAALELSDFAG